MDRKRKANTLGDNEKDGGSTRGGALLDTDGDTEQQMQIPDMLIPHIVSYCNDDTLKRCACVSRSWYTMVKMRLWNEVSESLLSYSVVWRKGVDSLKSARTYLKLYPCLPQNLDPAIYNDDVHIHWERQLTLPPLENESNPGRSFIDRHMRHITMLLLEQQPKEIKDMEKECVVKSLMCAIHIIQDDLKSVNELELKGLELPLCPTINTLGLIFDKKQDYYKRGPIKTANPPGLPEVRNQLIKEFRRIGGFSSLTKFLEVRTGHSSFPKHEHLQDILDGLREPESFQEPLAIPTFAANDTDALARDKRHRLLLLRHASKCTAENGTCTRVHCAEMKALWTHLAYCTDNECRVRHCRSSRYILSHYRRCRSPCNICDPVKELIKNGVPVYSSDSELEARALSKLMMKHELITFLSNPEENITRVERENICSVLKRIHQQHLFEQTTDDDSDTEGT